MFTTARSTSDAQEGLDRIDRAAQVAARAKVSLAAHGSIDYRNVSSLVELGLFEEFVVGGAVASRAILVSLTRAVQTFCSMIGRTPNQE